MGDLWDELVNEQPLIQPVIIKSNLSDLQIC